MKAIAKILIGVDMSTGILIYTILSLVFGIDFDLFVLIFAIWCAFLPDSDMVPYLLLRKKYGLVSHHIFFHHPPLFILFAGIISCFFAQWYGISGWYAVSIATCGSILHFIHDSCSPNGVGAHLFSPFSWKRYSFARGIIPHYVSDKFVREYYEELGMMSRKMDSALYEIVFRTEIEKITLKTVLFFIFSVSTLSCFYLKCF